MTLILVGLLSAGAAWADSTVQLASVHAAVGPLNSDDVFYAKRESIPVPIASVTKLMTAMVALDGGQPLDAWLPIVPLDKGHGKNRFTRLRKGSEATRADLLRLALMSSENAAAYALAWHYPGGVSAFVEAMNAKAASLGMRQTRFEGPTGLWTSNVSTADDLLKMVRAAYAYEIIRDYSTTYQYTATFRKPRTTIAFGNTNPLTASSRWDVTMSKTGYLTEAGRCLVMVATMDNAEIAIVLLNSFGTRTPLGDASRIRRWLTTGAGGQVAGPALAYERRVAKELATPGGDTTP